VGSTNSLLLQQKDRYSDILINLDEDTINISSASLRSSLALSAADRRWIDFITQSVNDTWDESNPGRPKTLGYVGSEEFIRLQFEEYLLSLISAVKCHNYLNEHANDPKAMLPQVEGDPAHDFGMDWIEAWTRSENYRIWESFTDSHLFDVVEPKHPCAGGLTIDDVQRRIAEQVKEFHLDERFAVGKEVLGRNLAAGKEKASTVFNKLYADMEALRESQRRKHEEQKREAASRSRPASIAGPPPDAKAQQSVSSKAGAYIGSWGTWMGEKRRAGWGRSASAGTTTTTTTPTVKKEKETAAATSASPLLSDDATTARPGTQESYREDIFDADSEAGHSSQTSDPPKTDSAPRASLSRSQDEEVVEVEAKHEEEDKDEEEVKDEEEDKDDDDTPPAAVPDVVLAPESAHWAEREEPIVVDPGAVADAVRAASGSPPPPVSSSS
jgi:hypothetical protein